MKKERVDYRYTESGLDNVVICDLEVKTDASGEKIYCLQYINKLHKAIATGILTKNSGISAEELRFLRTEMGYSQEELADVMKVSRATINRWENNKRVDPNTEFVLRMLAAEKLGVDINKSVKELADSCVWKAEVSTIRIKGSDPKNYAPIAA